MLVAGFKALDGLHMSDARLLFDDFHVRGLTEGVRSAFSELVLVHLICHLLIDILLLLVLVHGLLHEGGDERTHPRRLGFLPHLAVLTQGWPLLAVIFAVYYLEAVIILWLLSVLLFGLPLLLGGPDLVH